MADLEVTNHGSLFLLHSCTEVGRDWIEEHIPDDAQTLGRAIAVEPRYIEAIICGAIADGLEVE